MGYTGLVFDVVILVALAATIFYAHRLSKQFTSMQADRQAFEQLISALNLAASRAEAAIKALKEAAMQGGDSLQDKINKARELSDELEIMVQAGDNLASRLSNLAEGTRKNGGGAAPDTPVKAETPVAGNDAPQPRSRAEKELLEALKAKQQS